MHRNNTYRNKSIDKAELFYDYLCDQFYDSSKYDIDIDFIYYDTINHIDFNIFRIQKLLTNININKACGLDGIYGRVLKNCSQSLAYPL